MKREDGDELIRVVRELRELGADVITLGVNRIEFPRALPQARRQPLEPGGSKPAKPPSDDERRHERYRRIMGEGEG